VFLASLCKEPSPDGSLQIMDGIDGRKHLVEETLDHLDGYMGSKPARIGNGAITSCNSISTADFSTPLTGGS
jgi:hypothetical protein